MPALIDNETSSEIALIIELKTAGAVMQIQISHDIKSPSILCSLISNKIRPAIKDANAITTLVAAIVSFVMFLFENLSRKNATPNPILVITHKDMSIVNKNPGIVVRKNSPQRITMGTIIIDITAKMIPAVISLKLILS